MSLNRIFWGEVGWCVPLLLLRSLLLRSRAQTLLCHLLQLQPVHTAGGECDRPGHRAVRGVHVTAGQSGKWAHIFSLISATVLRASGGREGAGFDQKGGKSFKVTELPWGAPEVALSLGWGRGRGRRGAICPAWIRLEVSAVWASLTWGWVSHCHSQKLLAGEGLLVGLRLLTADWRARRMLSLQTDKVSVADKVWPTAAN